MAAGGRAARGRDVMGSDHAPLLAACAPWRREALGRTAGSTVTQRHDCERGELGRNGSGTVLCRAVPCVPPPVRAQYRTVLSSAQILARPGGALMPREGCVSVPRHRAWGAGGGCGAPRAQPGAGTGPRFLLRHRPSPTPSSHSPRPARGAAGTAPRVPPLPPGNRHPGGSGGRAALNGLLVLRWQQGHHPPACGPGPGQAPRPREPQAGPRGAAPLRLILIGAAICAGPGGT